jgi:hypothetical protein
MAAALTLRGAEGAPLRRCLAIGGAVVLVAMYVFYATLKDIVRESAARVPRLPPSIVEVHKPALPHSLASTADAVSPPAARYAYPASLATPASHGTPVRGTASTGTAAVTEVHKCTGPDGASYTDGPCPAGAHVDTLRLPGAAGSAAATL